MEWSAYIEFAERITLDEIGTSIGANPEAVARSATSRAYYGAFYLAMELARKRGFTPSGRADDHERIRHHFMAQPSPVAREVAQELWRMRDRRNRADYSKEIEAPDRLAGMALEGARFITDRLKRM